MSVAPPPPPAPPAGPYGGQYGVPPWPPSYAQTWAPAPALPTLPGSTAALVLGIVALAGGFVLLVPVAVAPVAWYLGATAWRRSQREPQQWRGAGTARTAMVLGMIGTGLLTLLTIFALVISVLMWVTVSAPSPY